MTVAPTTSSDGFSGLTVSVEQTAQGDHYVAYVVVNGVRFALSSVSAPGFDAQLAAVPTPASDPVA